MSAGDVHHSFAWNQLWLCGPKGLSWRGAKKWNVTIYQKKGCLESWGLSGGKSLLYLILKNWGERSPNKKDSVKGKSIALQTLFYWESWVEEILLEELHSEISPWITGMRVKSLIWKMRFWKLNFGWHLLVWHITVDQSSLCAFVPPVKWENNNIS